MNAAPRVTRRRFLAGTLAAGAGLLTIPPLRADQVAVDAHRFALLSDIHVPGDRNREIRGVKPAEHFVRVRDEILALRPRPAAAIVSGDLAINEGLPADYALLRELTEPLRQAGMPLHLLMGNHDRRQNLWQAFPECRSREEGLPPDKHVAWLASPQANWFFLDSMDSPGVVGGVMGQSQLQWLAKTLDAHADKPALVVAHHNPQQLDKPANDHSLRDTAAFFDVILPRKQVKAYFFGHSHCWSTTAVQGLSLVNLPAAAYVFDKRQPRGWIDAQVGPAGIALRFCALDRQHPLHDKVTHLTWRK